VTKVEAAQKRIADQFSADNDLSALNRISRLLQNTSEEIGNNLSLDDDRSALSRLRKELLGTIEGIVRRNHEFQVEVRSTLVGIQARREEAARSTRHGTTFEARLGDLLSSEAQRLGDVHRATGTSVGLIKSCKTGDHVTQLGPDSSAPGARIVWEAKEDKKYDLTQALGEIEAARKNRDAQVGIFVFSKTTSSADLQPFGRYANDIVIVWDADDPTSDVYVKAAYSVGRALSIRSRERVSRSDEALRSLEQATRAVEKQVQHLDQIKTWSETIRGHGEKIADRVGKMKDDLVKEVERLDREVAALKMVPAGSAV
jgi:gas vesicle protein